MGAFALRVIVREPVGREGRRKAALGTKGAPVQSRIVPRRIGACAQFAVRRYMVFQYFQVARKGVEHVVKVGGDASLSMRSIRLLF